MDDHKVVITLVSETAIRLPGVAGYLLASWDEMLYNWRERAALPIRDWKSDDLPCCSVVNAKNLIQTWHSL